MAAAEKEAISLNRALENTFKMMDYATHRGIALDIKAVEKVVAAGKAVRENTITDTQEVAFWASASEISKAITPVTIDSLNATLPRKRRWSGWSAKSFAATAAARYRVVTVITLIALLLFQIYWLIGATVLTDLKEIRAKLEKIEPDYDSTKQLLEELQTANRPEDQAQIRKLKSESNSIDSRILIERVSAATNFEVLRNWNIGKSLLLWSSSSQKIAWSQTNEAQSNDKSVFFLWVFTTENVVEMQTAQIILTALIRYILPILYGTLGAATYIARILSNDIKEATYSLDSKIRYQLRFALGAVAGFSIAWFTSDVKQAENVGIFQSLSPLALAFLAGYSVDLLFSLLDRLVVAFSGPEPRRTP
jgi:hypothetical protein